jgi:hypothetical protein
MVCQCFAVRPKLRVTRLFRISGLGVRCSQEIDFKPGYTYPCLPVGLSGHFSDTLRLPGSVLGIVKDPCVFGAGARIGQRHYACDLTDPLYGATELECQKNRGAGKTKVTREFRIGSGQSSRMVRAITQARLIIVPSSGITYDVARSHQVTLLEHFQAWCIP